MGGKLPLLLRLDRHFLGCDYHQMIWLALAAQMSLPISSSGISDVRGLFSYGDMPRYLIEAGEDLSKTVFTRTTVRPDGSTESCSVEVTSGDPKLDAYTCALIVKRGTFKPARWTDGSVAYGVIRVPISWRISNVNAPEEDALKSISPDLELSVKELPKGAGSIVGMMLELAADESGRIVSCMESPPSRNDRGKHFPELAPVACEQVAKSVPIKPPFDPAGRPMRSIQTASVHFNLDH